MLTVLEKPFLNIPFELAAKIFLPAVLLAVSLAPTARAAPQAFSTDTLIIPMDTGNPGFDNGQNNEMFQIGRAHV